MPRGGAGKKIGKKKNQAVNRIGDTNNYLNSVNDEQQLDQKGFVWVDPARVRFQHSRIRPHFSGCGRSLDETLDSIRNKKMSPSDLPPIQVIVGPDADEGPWYFSLNNRRLWVLKRCREEGLLVNNLVKCRVRAPKSNAEALRYSLENCAVEAKVMKASGKKGGGDSTNRQTLDADRGDDSADATTRDHTEKSAAGRPEESEASVDSESHDGSDNEDVIASKNPFSALL